MTWMRYYSKKIFGPYLGHMSVEKAEKYMAVVRIIYFFSASSLLILVLKARSQFKKDQLESGKPLIEDRSSGHQHFRSTGKDIGIIYELSPGKGMTKTEYNKNEYYQQIEKDALERAKEAQRKAIAEGRELPPDAIKLV